MDDLSEESAVHHLHPPLYSLIILLPFRSKYTFTKVISKSGGGGGAHKGLLFADEVRVFSAEVTCIWDPTDPYHIFHQFSLLSDIVGKGHRLKKALYVALWCLVVGGAYVGRSIGQLPLESRGEVDGGPWGEHLLLREDIVQPVGAGNALSLLHSLQPTHTHHPRPPRQPFQLTLEK